MTSATGPEPGARPQRRWELPGPEDPDGRGLYRPNRKFLYFILAALIVAAFVRGASNASQPRLARSCTTPAMAVRSTSYQPGGLVKLAVTGPANDTFAVYLDVAAVVIKNGRPTAIPAAGIPLSRTQVLFGPEALPHCLIEVRNELAGYVQGGKHTIELYRVAADGSSTEVQAITITVG